MKIAILVRRFITTGGAERYAVEVARRLAKKHEVHILAQEWDHEPPDMVLHRVSRPFKKPGWLARWWFSWQTSRLAKDFDAVYSIEKVLHFDVMSVQSQTFVSGLWSAGKSKFKIWSKIVTDPSVVGNWLLELMHYRQRPGRFWVAVSEMTKQNVQAAYPIPDARFFIAPSGVDLPVGNLAEQRAACRRGLGFKDEEVVLLFVGAEFRRKGLNALISALGQAKARGLKLVVVGGGDPKTYQKQASELNIAKDITWAGLVKNTSDYYAAADIYVLPTLSDPSPLSPLEAIAHGCAVVMSCGRFNGAAEQINDNEAILLNDPRNPTEIADAICRLLDPVLRQEQAARGRELAKRLSWDQVAEVISKTLEQSYMERHPDGKGS